MTSSSTSDLLCPNWVFSPNSNVHACKDRGWFSEYTPFESALGSLYLPDDEVPVVGVGKVVLPVQKRPKKSPGRSGSNHTHLVLHNVVHCPSALCNIIGYPTAMKQQYSIYSCFTKSSEGWIDDSQGRRITYFAPNEMLFQVKLSSPPVGPTVGPSVLEKGESYILNVHWPEPEQARWQAYKQSHGCSLPVAQGGEHRPEDHPQEDPKPETAEHVQFDARYTTTEKQWLKRHYNDEYHFLRDYGLSIYKDEDREQGRAIARQLMADESSGGEESNPVKLEKNKEPANTENCDSEDELERSEEDTERHMANWHFDNKSLAWINKHYGNAVNFMSSFGLKFYSEEDCAEAQSIVRALVAEDDSE